MGTRVLTRPGDTNQEVRSLSVKRRPPRPRPPRELGLRSDSTPPTETREVPPDLERPEGRRQDTVDVTSRLTSTGVKKGV